MTNQDPTRNLGFLVHEVARLMRRSFDRRVQSLGLTQAQWRALVHLSRCEGMNQAALAEILEIQPITLTRLLDKLQQSGWIERRQDQADRRMFRLYLTELAKPLLAELEAAGWCRSRRITAPSWKRRGPKSVPKPLRE